MLTWKETKTKLQLAFVGRLFYYIGAIRTNKRIDAFKQEFYSTKLRVLHPFGFLILVIMCIFAIPRSMFISEGLIDIYKYTFREICWW